jgi:predicted regulator of amino acid metabolism with ACT domain
MKPRQGVVRHKGKHVMFHVVIHIPIDESAERIHVNRSAVQTVIEHVLREAGMLCRIVNDHQPCAEEVRKND